MSYTVRRRARDLRERAVHAFGLGSMIYGRRCFSQEGEDLVLQRIFAEQESGFYVDVGAHHPTRFSNTYWAYLRGWCGMNIDPTPGSRQAFERLRPRDINLEVAIGATNGEATLFAFSEGALNTTVKGRGSYIQSLLDEETQPFSVPQRSLQSVFEELLPSGQTIDFLTIDVEGGESAVLHGNDWNAYRPRLVLLETFGQTLENWTESEDIQFLRSVGYTPMSLLFHTVVLVGDQDLRESWKGS